MNGKRNFSTAQGANDGKRINRAKAAIRGALLELGSDTKFSPVTSSLLGAYDHLAKTERDGDR